MIATEDSATHSLNLANDFPEAEESQTQHKETTPKNIRAGDRQSNNDMMEIVKCMKSEITSLKRKQETLKFANPPRLRKFCRMLDLTNNDMERECLTSEHTSRIKTSPEKRSHIKKGKSGKCGSSVSLNPGEENHGKLPVKQTSRKERSPEREI